MVDKKTVVKYGIAALIGGLVGAGVSRMVYNCSTEEKYNNLKELLEKKNQTISRLEQQLDKKNNTINKLHKEIADLNSKLGQKGLEAVYLPYGTVTIVEGKLPYKVFADLLNEGLDEVPLKQSTLTILYKGKQVKINSTLAGTVTAEAISKLIGLNYTGLDAIIGKVPKTIEVAKINGFYITNEKSGETTTLNNIVNYGDMIPKDTKFKIEFITSKGEYQIEVTADNIKTIAYLMKAENDARLIVWGDQSAKEDLKNLGKFLSSSYKLAIVKTKNGKTLLGLTKEYTDLQGKHKDRGVIVIPGKILEAPGQ